MVFVHNDQRRQIIAWETHTGTAMDSVATTAADNGANSSPKPSAETAAPVRGILKNQTSSSVAAAAGAGAGGAQLVWDEENLTLNEVQKDSTMKITEPKTPYVRYNAETDEVMDLDSSFPLPHHAANCKLLIIAWSLIRDTRIRAGTRRRRRNERGRAGRGCIVSSNLLSRSSESDNLATRLRGKREDGQGGCWSYGLCV